MHQNRDANLPLHGSHMKLLAIFVAFFALAYYLFGAEEVERHLTHRQIAQSPGFAPAIFEGISKHEGKRKGHVSYWVKFKYQVAGSTYRVSTSKTDEDGVKLFLGTTQQVAYDTRDPSVAKLKRYYDLARPGETLGQVLVVVVTICTGIALPITLFLAGCLWWLRRSRGKMPLDGNGGNLRNSRP